MMVMAPMAVMPIAIVIAVLIPIGMVIVAPMMIAKFDMGRSDDDLGYGSRQSYAKR